MNDTTERAAAHDFARIMSKVALRSSSAIEREVQRLSARLDLLERGSTIDLGAVLRSLSKPQEEGTTAIPTARKGSEDAARRLQRSLMTPLDEAEEIILVEALRVAEMMNAESEQNPWAMGSSAPSALLGRIEYMESQTRTLADVLCTIARYDREGRLSDAVTRTFEILAREPQPKGTHWSYARPLRMYPLVLCFYALATVAVAERRDAMLRSVLEVNFQRTNQEHEARLIEAIQEVRTTGDVFRAAMNERLYEPVAERIRRVVPVWCSPFLLGRPQLDAWLEAEFVVALSYLDGTTVPEHFRRPLPGTYLYAYEARAVLRRLLSRRPTWLSSLYSRPVIDLLKEFDRTAKEAVPMDAFGLGGFRDGAAKAWGADREG